MEPKKAIHLHDICRNSATVAPAIRVKYQRAWKKCPKILGPAPIQLLKAMAWVSENLDAFTSPFGMDKLFNKEDFKPRINLPPDFAIQFNTTKNGIEIYNKYGNLDYKTLGCLVLMVAGFDGKAIDRAGLKSLFPKGLASFSDATNIDDRIVPVLEGIPDWMRNILAQIAGPTGVENPTIEIYQGSHQMFSSPEEQDTPLMDVLATRFGITGLEKSKFKGPALSELVINLKLGMNTLCVGPTGTGKSECVLEAFNFADPDRDQRVIEGHESLREIDLLGGFVPGGKGEFNWADGILIQAMRNGSFLFVDEANRMPTRTLNVLLGVLSRGKVVLTDHGSEEVSCAAGFMVVMAMNQGQGYSVNSLDRALIDRFPCPIEFHYLDKKEELDLVVERTGIDRKIGAIMVKVGNDIRELARIGEFETGVSPRGLFAWAIKYMALSPVGDLNRSTLVSTATQTWIRGVAGVGVDGYMEREVVNKLTAMIYDARA